MGKLTCYCKIIPRSSNNSLCIIKQIIIIVVGSKITRPKRGIKCCAGVAGVHTAGKGTNSIKTDVLGVCFGEFYSEMSMYL